MSWRSLICFHAYSACLNYPLCSGRISYSCEWVSCSASLTTSDRRSKLSGRAAIASTVIILARRCDRLSDVANIRGHSSSTRASTQGRELKSVCSVCVSRKYALVSASLISSSHAMCKAASSHPTPPPPPKRGPEVIQATLTLHFLHPAPAFLTCYATPTSSTSPNDPTAHNCTFVSQPAQSRTTSTNTHI